MSNKKGEVSIGTLIIFISMILVAAIAAGVLIQTGTSLQNKALTTGDRTRGQVGSQIMGLSLTGTDGTQGFLSDFVLKIKLSPGGEASTLLSDGGVLLSFDGDVLSGDYTFDPDIECQRDSNGDGTAGDGYYFNSSTRMGTFGVTYPMKGRNHDFGSIVPGDVIEICFAAPGPIYENSRVKVTFVPSRGSPLVIESALPHVMPRDLVVIYP